MLATPRASPDDRHRASSRRQSSPVSPKVGASSIPSARERTMCRINLGQWPAVSRTPWRSQRCSPLREFECARCERSAWVCRCCDRGQKYCSWACSREVRLAAQREASRCYQQTEVGRAHHAERSARYRRRQREKQRAARAGVTQHCLVFSEKERKLWGSPPARRCVVCAAPGHRAPWRRAAARPMRRAAPWRSRRVPRTESSSWSTTSWSCATRIYVCAGRAWRAVYSRAWSRTASSFRWW